MRPHVILSLFLAGPSFGWDHAGETKLREALRSNDYTVAAFVLPSQETSQGLEQEWSRIQMAEGAHAVSIDCAEQPAVCRELDVVSYPAIRLYRSEGEQVRYRGVRQASSITSFVRRQLRPALSTVDRHNVSWFASADDVVFEARLKPGDVGAHTRFAALAHRFRDRYSFAVNTDAQPTQSEALCHNKRDGLQKRLPDLGLVGALESFVDQCATPLIPELTRRNELQYLKTGKSMVRYFVSSQKQRDRYVDEMRPLAKKYLEFLHFATVDATEYPDAVAMFGHAPGSSGVLSVQNPTSGAVFPYRGRDVSKAAIESFLGEVVAGKVAAWTGERVDEMEQEVEHEEL